MNIVIVRTWNCRTDGQGGIILTLPIIRMRNLRSYKQIETLSYDEIEPIYVG